MSGLAELQRTMAAMLTRRRALPNDPAVTANATSIAAGNERLSPAEQLEIYREQFWLRHTSCLADDFAGLGGILGQSDWERLVEEYLEHHPPQSFNLRDLGDRLPAFVESSTWLPHHALCVDMARLEWCYVEVFDAPDAAPLDPEVLAAVPESAWEGARLDVAPALRLLRVRHPVATLRRRIRGGEPDVPIPEPEPQNLCVYRGRDRNLYHQVLSDAAYDVLCRLRDDTPLGRACEAAAGRSPEAASEIESRVGEWFHAWARDAIVVGVRTEKP